MAVEEIYKEVILDHYKRPRNKREVPGATASCDRTNPLCGDEIHVEVRERDGLIEDVAFGGQGCSISQASASMMTEALTGKDRAEAAEVIASVRRMLTGAEEPDESLGDLVALKGVVRYPVRIKCAALTWDVLEGALAELPSS